MAANALTRVVTDKKKKKNKEREFPYINIAWEDKKNPYDWPEGITSELYHANSIYEYTMQSTYCMIEKCLQRIYDSNAGRIFLEKDPEKNVEFLYKPETRIALCCSIVYYQSNLSFKNLFSISTSKVLFHSISIR